MKTLDQFITFYLTQHRNRIDKEIAKEPLDHHKETLIKNKSYYSTENESLLANLTLWYNSLATKQPSDLCCYRCLSINKIIWKTVAYTIGIPTFKTEKHLHQWISDYYGKAFTDWQEQVAQHKKEKQAKEEQQRIIDEEQRKQSQDKRTIAQAHELKFADRETIHDFTAKYYAKGYRLIQVRHGFGHRNRITNPSTGEYMHLKQPRRKDHRHHHFTETIYAYFALYESQQTTKKPPLTERFPFKKSCLQSV